VERKDGSKDGHEESSFKFRFRKLYVQSMHSNRECRGINSRDALYGVGRHRKKVRIAHH
jgi:hypothetical protein